VASRLWRNPTKVDVEGLSEGLAQDVAVLGNTGLIVKPGAICTHWAGCSVKQGRPEIANSAHTAGAHRWRNVCARASSPACSDQRSSAEA
jgi:hypothetical protein